MRLTRSRRVEAERFRFTDCLYTPINGWWPNCWISNLSIGLASQHALNESGGFDESVRARKPRCLEHHVIHIGGTFARSQATRTVLVRVKSLSPTRFFFIAFYRREQP